MKRSRVGRSRFVWTFGSICWPSFGFWDTFEFASDTFSCPHALLHTCQQIQRHLKSLRHVGHWLISRQIKHE